VYLRDADITKEILKGMHPVVLVQFYYFYSYRQNATTIIISEIMGFRTLSIVHVLKDKTKEEHDVSETESISVLR
jgi:hypothetical protein